MQNNSYTIRTMSRQQVDIAIQWAAAEGWNPGLHDAVCFYTADPNGFLIGLLGDEPIATISAVKYGETFGFLGLYIVKPDYRGKGYGIQIWNAGLEYLANRTIGLDSVVAQQDNYKKSGFVLAYRHVRYQGTSDGQHQVHAGIVPLSELTFDDVYIYDKAFFPDDRVDFLKYWINQPQGIALGILQNRKLTGYGVLRRCRSGYKIGPLFADNPEFAEYLFAALKSYIPEGDSFFLDVPEVNPAAVDLAKRHSMTVTFETARMYKGQCRDLPINRMFGVTTLELG